MRLDKFLQVGLGHNTRTSVNGQLHVADLLVDICHELNDEVHKLVLEHALGVEVGDQETDVITLGKKISL